jgi:phospholipid transport system transporter-binding protein
VLLLPQALTQNEANACLRELLAAMRSEAGGETVVDASALKRFDSSALAVLIGLRRESLRLGKRFSVRGLPLRLGNLADLYGIAELVPSELTSA